MLSHYFCALARFSSLCFSVIPRKPGRTGVSNKKDRAIVDRSWMTTSSGGGGGGERREEKGGR